MRSLRYHETVLIISEKANRSNFYLSHYVLEKEKLKQSLEDLKLIKQVKARIELPILIDIIYMTDVEVVLKFSSDEPAWKI